MTYRQKRRPHRASVILPLFLSIAGACAVSNAATIVLSDTLDEEINFFDEDDSIAQVNSSGGASPFVYSFSSMGETVISYTWQAPAGQRFVVTPPINASSAFVMLRFDGGTLGSTPVFQDNSPLLEIIGASGPVIVESSRTFFTGSGSGDNRVFLFEAIFDVTPGQSFSFESATMTTTIPDSYNTDFAVTTTTSFLYGEAETPSSAGQWITLEAVPEPGTSLLLALSLTSLVARRRRC